MIAGGEGSHDEARVMKNCPQCHQSYPPHLVACPEDGSLLEDFGGPQPGDALSSMSLAEFAPADIVHDEPFSPTALAAADQQPEIVFEAEPVPDLLVETPVPLLGAQGAANDVDAVAPPELPLWDVAAGEPEVLEAQAVEDQPNQPLSTAPTQDLSGVQIRSAPHPGGRVPNPLGVPTPKNRLDQSVKVSSVQSLFGAQTPETRPEQLQQGRRVRAGLILLAVIVFVSFGSWLVMRKASSVKVQPEASPSSQPSLGSSSAPSPASPAASPVPSGETAASSTSVQIPSPAPPPPTLVSGGGASESVKAEPKAPPRGLEPKSAKRAETPARKLSPAELAELKDKLVLGLFFMERNDYDAAVGAFGAALKVDPTNRAAQDGIRRARKARNAQKANTRP